MVADGLEKRPLLASVRRKLDKRLQEPLEEFLPPQAVLVEVLVHLVNVAPLPKVHQAMNPVNERNGPAAGGIETERSVLALRPGFELYFVAGIILGLGISFRIGVRLLRFLVIRRLPLCEADEVPGIGEFFVRDAARDGLKDASSRRGFIQAEVVAVEEVVCGRLVETIGGGKFRAIIFVA